MASSAPRDHSESVTLTVTPSNVDGLAARVRELARGGIKRIALNGVIDEGWSAAAVEAWEREQRRIGTWLIGAQGAGTVVPELVGMLHSPRPAPRVSPSRWAAVAVLSAAVTSAGSAASCGGEATTGPGTSPSSDGGDAAADQGHPDGDATSEYMGGQCPVLIDADLDQYMGGYCAEVPDAHDEYTGGLCK
ncbi:MAG: hypothetical protein HY898_00480 [Deltaproteobacteria bacterium]|nr:hypothetical protein [Deltaproteobacteria bacterium]